MKFTDKQSSEIMEVYSGYRSRMDGSVKMNGISLAVKRYLTGMSGLLIKIDGRYYARKLGTYDERAEYLNPCWRDLPIETVFFVVSSALDERGYCGRSILNKKSIWNDLNLYCDIPKREEEIMRILCELDANRFIYFQFSGDIWAIELRKDRLAVIA